VSGHDLATHPIHRMAPIGDPYVLGRWHHDRATWKGYTFEARVFLKSLIRHNDTQRFLLMGRPRSGTTLFQRLLNQVEGTHCDGEVLHHAVLNPRGFLNQLAGIKSSRAWGCKLLSYQMFEVQRISDHRAFLEGLLADGFRLIHVRRRTYDQSLSLSVAQAINAQAIDQYHIQEGGSAPMRHLSLDPARFVDQLHWNLAMLDYETRLLADLPHMLVDYGADLENPASHQFAVDRTCKGLGLPPGPVAADLSRTAQKRQIDNLDAVHAAVRKAGLGHVLDDPTA
jgi:hypothetical protein